MRNVQSTDRGGELLKGGAWPRKSAPINRGVESTGSTTAMSGETGVRFTGTCATVAGMGFPAEISQQVPPACLACNSVPGGQCGPQHSCVFAGDPRMQAPNADRPLASRTKASTAATNLILLGIRKYRLQQYHKRKTSCTHSSVTVVTTVRHRESPPNLSGL